MVRRLLRRITTHPRYAELRQNLQLPEYAGTRFTARRVLNLYLARWESARGRTRLWSRPTKLTVEATNICNLECPACFTGAGDLGRPRSHLSLDLYRQVLAELGPYLLEVEFYNWGEPLLAKHIFPMIEEASAAGAHTTVSTNFSFPFDAGRAERLVSSGLSVLGVSIDGARQETYEQYRRRGKLEKVLENCRTVRDAKRRLGSATPRLVWEFHVFSHNTEDIEEARALARELEMDIAVDKGWVVGSEWDTEGKFRYYADPTPHRCPFLWTQAVINNDGGVAPCCGTFFHEDDMGALPAERGAPGARSFREIWNNPKFRASRRFFRSRTGSPDEQQLACYECPITKIWENYGQHVAAGGTRETFQVGYSTNDCFNYFWNRRPVPPAAANAGGRPAALAR